LEEGGREMNTILLIIIGILLTVELGMIMFCEYWRENNPWKWFVIKTLTTLLIVIYIVNDKELITMFDLIICAVLGAGLGIDFASTYIDSKKKDSYGA
jgi:hypothetical protein